MALSVGSCCCPYSRVHSAGDPGIVPPLGLLHKLGIPMQGPGFRSRDSVLTQGELRPLRSTSRP
jgi:hypothetical protein